MPDELRLLAGFALAAAAALAATPLAIAVATRTGFNDQPVGYKGHKAPTPYLGGAAVVGAFLVGGLTLGGELARLSPIVVLTFGVWCLGTVDDKLNLSAQVRLSVEFVAASALWATDLGWEVTGSPVLDLLITNVWVVGLVNAFNLMDNMDGAAATVGAATTLVTAVLALVEGDVALAVLCAGMCGACVGFLPYNLAGPAKIFLGDGGSLPVGFVVAATIMAVPHGGGSEWTGLLAAVVLAGVPVVDTGLVMISRRRAGAPLLTGARDHLTHRLSTRLVDPRRVALALGAVQLLVGAIAAGVVQLGEGFVVSAWTTWFVVAAAAVVVLETSSWAPAREPRPARPDPVPRSRRLLRSPTPVEAAAILFITLACGLSPALYGFYDLSIWGPIALFLLAGLLGLVIARPAALRPAALAAVGGLVFVWAWSLLSTRWSESADQALIASNRWMLYAALLAALLLLLRDDRLARLMLASATAAILAFGGYLIVRLLGPDGGDLFLSNRLQEPLGYANGQGAYLLIGLWPLVAAAERARSHVLSGAAVGGAALLVGLTLLGQTRALLPALAISAVLLVAVLPGRQRRLWALLAIAAGTAVAAGPLLDVFAGADPAAGPDPDTLQRAVITLLGTSAITGAVWGLARALASNARKRFGGRALGLASVLALGVLLAASAVGALAAVGDPVDRAREELRAFRDLDVTRGAESPTRFTSGGGYRYDYWRVAVGQFGDEPVRGVGAGNYDRGWFRERRIAEDIRQPHSLPLQTLAELGVVGAIGLLVFLGAVLAGFVRRARAARGSRDELALAVAGGGMFTLWLVHTSVDWLHLIPGVTGFALCGAAVLLGPWKRERGDAGRSRKRIVTVAVCGLLVLFGAALVGRAALAAKHRSEAQELVRSDPRRALNKAADSLRLNDEAVGTYHAQAAAYARLGQYGPARASLVEATRREPGDFVTWALLGDLAARRGDLRQAGSDYRRAAQLNPREPGLGRLAQNPREALRR
ncbi:MAG: O-antigen ligase family protein [Actinomycetota bacterium]|nr:O-antigen ligase family protein [Actinomycetota bacterium]